MGAMASQITSLTIVYSTVYSGPNQRKHQSSASLAFVRGIHRWPVNYLHKWPVTRKMFPFDDFIMYFHYIHTSVNILNKVSDGVILSKLVKYVHFKAHLKDHVLIVRSGVVNHDTWRQTAVNSYNLSPLEGQTGLFAMILTEILMTTVDNHNDSPGNKIIKRCQHMSLLVLCWGNTPVVYPQKGLVICHTA